MKRCYIQFFSAAIIGCIMLFTSCNASESKPDTLLVKNSLDPAELERLDIEREAIAPEYLPFVLGDEEINSSYHKSGLTATIEADNNIIANFEFCKLKSGASDQNFPSPGEALVSESNDTIVIHYRMSDSYGCMITSDSLSEQELEKIINSFTIRSVPGSESPALHTKPPKPVESGDVTTNQDTISNQTNGDLRRYTPYANQFDELFNIIFTPGAKLEVVTMQVSDIEYGDDYIFSGYKAKVNENYWLRKELFPFLLVDKESPVKVEVSHNAWWVLEPDSGGYLVGGMSSKLMKEFLDPIRQMQGDNFYFDLYLVSGEVVLAAQGQLP